ncbi:response regulator transcription factor [Ruminococcus sp.]|uniref:response regulator transcription factor n=1 Tax=Ruminococcus sp. TaxID=41978 RepID=UPI00258AAB59|nr:response regulator transcription factor [Ruminococcus sp.]MCR5019781.1 response regulator transcription factor [Ruminococcus sp.]
MKLRIAVVEDDREISSILKELLESSGYECVQAFDGDEASRLLKNERFDMVLMDLMLPYKNGERLIGELRSRSETPVIVISAKSMMETKLDVLRLGADDYIIKPFDIDEVLVRIEVVLRRSGAFAARPVLEVGDLSMNTEENTVSANGGQVQLTAKEFMLLKLFMEHPQKVYTKAELYETVWNEVYYYEDNTINVHVSNLRSKLKKVSGKDHIETVWGIGYRLKGACQ